MPVVIDEPAKVNVETLEFNFRGLGVIILMQARIRRYLKLLRRKKSDLHAESGVILDAFYLRKDEWRFLIKIYKVKVAHKKITTHTKHIRTAVRHRDEAEMHDTTEKTE